MKVTSKAQYKLSDVPEGTYAFAALSDAAPKCSEAVEGWNKALENFSGLPPVFSDSTKSLYYTSVNSSFVALYNPGVDPTADCRVVACTKTMSVDATDSPTEDKLALTTGYAFICLTSPPALTLDEAPFT